MRLICYSRERWSDRTHHLCPRRLCLRYMYLTIWCTVFLDSHNNKLFSFAIWPLDVRSSQITQLFFIFRGSCGYTSSTSNNDGDWWARSSNATSPIFSQHHRMALQILWSISSTKTQYSVTCYRRDHILRSNPQLFGRIPKYRWSLSTAIYFLFVLCHYGVTSILPQKMASISTVRSSSAFGPVCVTW